MVKTHPSPIHYLFDAFKLQPQEIEAIQPYTFNPTTTLPFTTDIPSSRRDGIEKAIVATTNSDIQIYTDGSANEEDVGAAAVLYREGEEQSALLYHLGSLSEHTVYEAEAVGVLLGLHLLRQEVGPGRTVLGLDNTAVIRASKNGRARPGQHLISRIRTHAQRAQRAFGGAGSQYELSISWTPGHEGVGGNEAADAAAMMAALSATASSPARALPSFLRDGLPKSKYALRRAFTAELKARWDGLWRQSPRYRRYTHVAEDISPSRSRRILLSRPRHEMSALVQLRTGHAPLNKHLHRINCAESAGCDACNAPAESVRHFVMDCPAYTEERWSMRLRLRRESQSLSRILFTESDLNELAKYVARTGRFRSIHTAPIRR